MELCKHYLEEAQEGSVRLLFLPIIFFCLMVVGTVAAQTNIIEEVRIVGESRVPETTIRSHLKMRAGSLYDRDVISEDVRALFKLGQFNDITVLESAGSKGTLLTYRIDEKPILSAIKFEGNKKVKEKEFKESLKIHPYQPFDEKKFAETIEAFKKLYAKKHFYLVEFSYRFHTTKEGDSQLIIEIHENRPAFIRKVEFVGNRVFTDQELRAVIGTKRKGPFAFFTNSGQYKEESLKQDVQRLTFFYLKHGYLKVQVGDPTVALTKDKRYFFVNFQVHEGDRYRIGKVGFEGDILTTEAELLARLKTKTGDIYNREFLEIDLQGLTSLYGDQGYAFANVIPRTNPDDVNKTADILFHITKGARIKIEKIVIEGNTVTRDKVIRRELRIKENDLYNESKLQESRRLLMALGFFKEVNFATPRGTRDDTVILKISVEEQPTGSFSLGAGFSTAENFIFNASIQKNNFFGFGISGQASVEFSKIRQQFLLEFTDPHFLDTEWILGISGFRQVYAYNDFDRRSYGGGLSIGHRIFDYSSVNLGYDAEQVSISSFGTNVPEFFRKNASGLTSNVNFTLSRDTRDNRIYARSGTFNSAKFEWSGEEFGGDNDFFRTTLRSQLFQPVFGGIVFKTFGRIGYITGLKNKTIPLFERFYLGGANSLRGYFPFSIGPRLRIPASESGGDTNFVYGGNKMMSFNAELEFPIYDPAGIRFVTFFDAGNSFAEEQSYSVDNLRMDYGFGLRWVSPFGPLRFEWGLPIHRRFGEDSVVFNFTIGQFF